MSGDPLKGEWTPPGPPGISFDRQVAVVAGAGATGEGIGNGRAAAFLLAQHGAHVICVDRRSDEGQATVDMIAESGGSASFFAADATSDDDAASLAAQAQAAHGGIDILINNVGIGSRGSVVESDPADWNRVMEINVGSAVTMARHVIPVMTERGGGAIVNVSSIAALRPRGLTAYSTSKGAIIALTKAMAVDHARDGIRVNCVAPGPVFTPMVAAGGMTDELRARRRNASPLGVEGTGWDIGHAVMFLASAQARYITGQTLIVDGGVTLTAASR